MTAFMVLALVLNGILFCGSLFAYTAPERFSRVVSVLMHAAVLTGSGLFAILGNLTLAAPALDVAVAIQLATALLSMFAPMSVRFNRDWSLRGASRRVAAAELVRKYARASREARRTRSYPAERRTTGALLPALVRR
jgi:hypothetical protein